MKNVYMAAQIQNMVSILHAFRQSLKLAASQDDGKMDKREEKALRRIDAAAEKFLAELQKAKQE